MDKNYLSIKDFAQKAGVSQQAIYKQVERKLKGYIKLVDNQKMIDIRALQEVYGVEVVQPIQPKVEEVKQPIQPNEQAIIDNLFKELERKSEELRAKDKQYSELQATMNEQLKAKDEQIANLGKLLDQEQHLNAMNHEKILLLESKLEEPSTEPIEPDEPPTEQKGFWARIFKK